MCQGGSGGAAAPPAKIHVGMFIIQYVNILCFFSCIPRPKIGLYIYIHIMKSLQQCPAQAMEEDEATRGAEEEENKVAEEV